MENRGKIWQTFNIEAKRSKNTLVSGNVVDEKNLHTGGWKFFF